MCIRDRVHPVFLYESLWCLLLFLLMLVWKRKKHFHGEVFLKYLAGYGLGRFCIELLRTDKLMIPGTSVGISQLISAALFVICAMIAVVEETMAKKRAARRRRRREQDYEAVSYTHLCRERSLKELQASIISMRKTVMFTNVKQKEFFERIISSLW